VRARLVIVFTIPLVLLFLVLGAAYVSTVARSAQQELFLDRLGDASYLVVNARQSLTADDPGIVADDLRRYREVYGIEAAVLNQAGEIWASNGLDVTPIEERFVALAGRRNELSEHLLPWDFGTLVVAEPVFEGGDLIGAVITASGTEQLAQRLWVHWGAWLAGGLAVLGLSLLVAYRLAAWVLRPVRAVDGAMAEMQAGHMEARIPESSGPPELRQVIVQFNRMAEKVERLMQKHEEFVSNASHELRNPLNALLLRVESLGLTLPDDRTEEMDHVRAEGRRLARILDALLMLARDEDLAAGSEPVELGTLVARRVDGWRPIAAERDVELRLSCNGEVWATLDEIVVESAFDAVADNAVKFAPAGTAVDVTVTANGDTAEISVRDHGPGLTPDEIEKVTERFWRSPAHRAVRGSGLGLSIARELLASCGGRLDITVADGGGLVVRLRVPVDSGVRS
jgi:signal transduction histidine kinase